jgi:hypothetical protein
VAAVIGVWLGRRAEANPPIARLLATAKAQTTLPELRPGLTVANRLWPLLGSTFVAGVIGFFLPQVAAVAAGFAIIWALAWRRQESAVAAIEERDAVRFYVDKTSPAEPDPARADAGLRRHVPGEAVTRPDVLLVSLGGTAGLREADEELAAPFERAGRTVVVAAAERPREWRTYAAIELAWALAARSAARAAIDEHRPRAVMYFRRQPRLCWREAGGDPLRRPRRRQPPGPPRWCGSARSSGAGCSDPPLLVRGARAGWPRRRARTRTRSSFRSRRALRPRRRAGRSRHHLRRESVKKGLDRVLAAWEDRPA